MNRRGFLHLLSASVLSLQTLPTRASLLPPNPVFGQTFEDIEGAPVPLSRFQGKPVLMNFWASWCAPCVREMPLLEALHHEYPDLVVLGLAIDTGANVRRFLDRVEVSYPVLLTATRGIPLMRELGNKGGGLPFTVCFNREGRLEASHVGELKPDDAQALLKQIL